MNVKNKKINCMDLEVKFLMDIADPKMQQHIGDCFFRHQIALQVLMREMQLKERRADRINSAAHELGQAAQEIRDALTYKGYEGI